MRKVSKKVSVMIISLILFLVAIIIAFPKVNSLITKSKLDSETLRAMTYGELEAEDYETQSENVEFSVFFARDLNNDGYAERVRGTAKEIGTKDELYAELKISTSGYLKDGIIALDGKNFTWDTAIVEDNVVSGNYIGTVNTINLKEKVYSGSQKLFVGNIKDELGSNINDYSKVSTMTLTGTYVDDEGNETPINVTRSFTVDWYGNIETTVNTTNQEMNTSESEDYMYVSCIVKSSEKKEELLLKDNIVTATAPELNGYKALDATVTGKFTSYEFDDETSTVTIIKSSTLNDDGSVTNLVTSLNQYTIKFRYPKEAWAYVSLENPDQNFKIEIPVTAKYTAYNNQNPEFDNILESEKEGVIALVEDKKLTTGVIVKESGATVGTASGNRYIVSKEKAIQAYNNIETEEDTYVVKWHQLTELYTNKSIMKEDRPDSFPGTNKDVSDIVSYNGIYFSVRGIVRSIEVYNDDTDELIHTFLNDEVHRYVENNPYIYEENVKKIRVEVNGANRNANINVNNIKQIDHDLLLETLNKEEFDVVSGIYSYFNYVYEDDPNVIFTAYAEFKDRESEASMSLSKTKLQTIDKSINEKITIKTSASRYNQKGWKNGEFLVRMPDSIVYAQINDVTINNQNVEILGYDLYKEGNYYFVKIITENSKEEVYNITIDSDIVLNPITPTKEDRFVLYGYNENCHTYFNYGVDAYDINNNSNTQELVSVFSSYVNIIAPSTLITSQIANNYNEEGDATVAPNIADITKDTRTVDINVQLFNNYEKTVSETKILGTIPFEGNTYISSGEAIGSQFTSQMTTDGITVPNDLRGLVTVYYSENENADIDLENEENGWTLTPTDFSKVKRYLIDFGNKKISSGSNYTFKYTVQIPEGIDYNKVSYSEHLVYFSLDTNDGKLETQVEPNKLGIRIARKCELNLLKLNAENRKPVAGAVYRLTQFDDSENEIDSKLVITDAFGNLVVKEIYINSIYTLEEIKSPDSYMLNKDKIKFVVREDIENANQLAIEVLSEDSFSTTPTIENNKIIAQLIDEPRYKITITKKDDKTGETLSGVRFYVPEQGETYTTDKNGVVTITKLEQNKDYTLKEIYADGYYLLGDIEFKLYKNEAGEFKLQSNNDKFSNAEPVVVDGEDLIEIELELEDTRKTSILINKIDKTTSNPIKNVQFSVEDRTGKVYKTDGDGKVLINGFEEDTDYTVKELKAEGYYLEEVSFKVVRDANNKLKIESDNEEFAEGTLLDEDKKIISVTMTNESVPTYDLDILKLSEGTTNPLQGAKFGFTRLDDETYEEYTTDENGIISISGLYAYVEGKNLTGEYTLKEIEAPSGYSNSLEEIKFKVVKSGDNYELEVENEDNLTTYHQGSFENGKLQLIIDNKPLFTLEKIDEITKEPLAGASFIIKEIDFPFDYAKDINGNYVGELDEEGRYIVTTDENGRITLALASGRYVLIEVGFPIGYEETEVMQYFEVKAGLSAMSDEEVSEVYYIEDLVNLSNQVNSGKNAYTDKTVTLTRTLDFNSDESYFNPLDKSFGDLNGDRKIDGIKVELTKEDGSGFTPIGINNTLYFAGTFDGNYNEIRNLYINSSNVYLGLIGRTTSPIKNLGVTGKIIIKYGSTYVGGIVGSTYANVEKCYSKVDIESSEAGATVGGIAGISISFAAPKNCYYTGNIRLVRESGRIGKAGGICGSAGSTNSCYNVGNLEAATVGAINAVYDVYEGSNLPGGVEYIYTHPNNCYYSSDAILSGDTIDTQGTEKTSEYMKTAEFIQDLNPEVFVLDTENTNDGYPIFDTNIPGDVRISQIDSIEDLLLFSNQLNNGVDYSDLEVTLEKDLDFTDDSSYENPNDDSFGDLNGDETVEGIKAELTNQAGTGFKPISSFNGVFNGKGHEIKNIYLTTAVNNRLGLFGTIQSGSIIKNLGISGNISVNSNISRIGSLVGECYGNIYNCYSNVTINVTSQYSSAMIGGLIGYNTGTIKNSYNNGSITYVGSSSEYIGGLVGQQYNGKIENCYNTGNITYTGSTSSYSGGIAGRNLYAIIKNCYDIGELNSSARIGAIVGYNSSGKYSNNYYMYGVHKAGTQSSAVNGIYITSDNMKTEEFVERLNQYAYTMDTNNKNNGYPILLNYDDTSTEPVRTIEIEYIEDLTDLTTALNNGDTFDNAKIVLTRSLDFNDDASYRDPDAQTWDINQNGTTEGLKVEYTTGSGFRPIGFEATWTFEGIFDGNNNEIKNLYINRSSSPVGLFSYANNCVIQNLNVSGNIVSTSDTGMIVGNMTGGKFINCHTKGTIVGGSYAGGIIGLWRKW